MTKKEMNLTLAALKKLHQAFPRLSVQQLIILLMIGVHEEIDQQSLTRMVDFSRASVSKHVRKFADLTWDKREGADYVQVRRDPMNLNTNNITLTEKGIEFLKNI